MKNLNKQIDWIKDFVKIEEVVSLYVHLIHKPGGKSVALCPFHSDHNPSLRVDSNRNIFKCFACNEGGNAIAFVMKIENCSFPEAVEHIASRLGGPAAEDEKGNIHTKVSKRKPVSSEALTPKSASCCHDGESKRETSGCINTDGTTEAESNFLTMCPGTSSGTKKEATASQLAAEEEDNRTFQKSLHGYTPDCGGLAGSYMEFGVGMAGLQPPRGFNFMRGRIVFPILDEQGRLAGFTARRMSDPLASNSGPHASAVESSPKYINSRNSALYNKSHILYGLYQARTAIQNEGLCYLCEGTKDVLAMHAAGLTNVVALCGSALTQPQIELLSRYTNRIALVLDSDAPGQAAAAKAATQLKEAGFRVINLLLPAGEDPDSLFCRLGKEAYLSVLRESVEALPSVPVSIESSPQSETPFTVTDRPRLEMQEKSLTDEIARLFKRIFMEGRTPLRSQLYNRLMICHIRLREISKQLGRPATFGLKPSPSGAD